MANATNLGSGGLRPLRFGSFKRDFMDIKCNGQHDIFVCDNLYVQSEGKIVTVAICRNCAQFYYGERQIAQPHQGAEFLKEKENK